MGYGIRDGVADIRDDINNSIDAGFDMGNIRTKSRKRKSIKNRKMGRKASRSKRVKSSKGGIKYTKNGQPYKIMANGRARFIKGKRRK